MKECLSPWLDGFVFSGDAKADVRRLLLHHDLPRVAEHSFHVSEEAKRLAEQFGVNPAEAEIAGLLHDISAIIPNRERIALAKALELPVLPEEERFPMIVHQKLSQTMAREWFGIVNQEILDAIGCHTTLRAKATPLDMVLFVADKIRWDQPGTPPYLHEISEALNHSLSAAAFAYIRYLWSQREKLIVVHPWLEEAYRELSRELAAD
jgi:predicted HD superfamily hydrolase involved in NAD metabolism